MTAGNTNKNRFFHDGTRLRRGRVKCALRKIRALSDFFSRQKIFKFYASSLLLTYDSADPAPPGPEEEEEVAVCMIDFAHAVPVDGDGELGEGPAEAPGDKGYLYGAKNVSFCVRCGTVFIATSVTGYLWLMGVPQICSRGVVVCALSPAFRHPGLRTVAFTNSLRCKLTASVLMVKEIGRSVGYVRCLTRSHLCLPCVPCACRCMQLVGIMEELLEVTAAAPAAPLDVDGLSAKLKFMTNIKNNYVDDA